LESIIKLFHADSAFISPYSGGFFSSNHLEPININVIKSFTLSMIWLDLRHDARRCIEMTARFLSYNQSTFRLIN